MKTVEECPKCGHEHEYTIVSEMVVVCSKCGDVFVVKLDGDIK